MIFLNLVVTKRFYVYYFYDLDEKQKNKDGVREFEFKSKHLRVYGITRPNGKIVITGGTKAKQKEDQNAFRLLKRKYLSWLKTETKKTTKK